MTDDRRSDDELLSDRIRRSMAHHTFERTLPPPRTSAAAWHWPVLAGAALAGALVATLVISLLGGLPRGPVGNASPTPQMSTSPTPAASSAESPLPSPVSQELADTVCRDGHTIDHSWLLPGETEDQVADRLRQLPLLHVDRRDHADFFVYADDRFNLECQIDRRSDGEQTSMVVLDPREADGGGLEYSGGGSSPAGADPVARPPDLWMYGTVAPRIDRVEIVLADGGSVPAWLGGGVWFAWWNTPISSVGIRAYDRDGTVLTLDEGLKAIILDPEPTPEPTPWPGLPTQFDGVLDACATDSADVPQEWIRPGDLRGQVLQRLRRLPLVNVDIRDFAASYLFADSRFIIECRIYRTFEADPEVSVARTLRQDPGQGLVYEFGSARAPGGGPSGTWPADLLMVGTAAQRFERVEVILDDGSAVPAALASGMWIAWWNTPVAAVEVRGYAADGAVTSIEAHLELARQPGE